MKKGGANGYAALVKQRAEGKTKRRTLDDYETPEDKVAYLVEHASGILSAKTTLEPAAGSGRIARVLREAGHKVVCQDIKDGQDFTKRTKKFAGNIVTNPPYRDGLADIFAAKSLALADGGVALLMEAKFLFGDKRTRALFQKTPPALIILIPERIYFYEGSGPKASQISSQFYNHVWIVWPSRAMRDAGKVQTRTVWACASDS